MSSPYWKNLFCLRRNVVNFYPWTAFIALIGHNYDFSKWHSSPPSLFIFIFSKSWIETIILMIKWSNLWNFYSRRSLIFCCELSFHRYLPSVHRKQLFRFMPPDERFLECDHISYEEHDDKCNFSNFMDADWLSSSANSCEDETCDR